MVKKDKESGWYQNLLDAITFTVPKVTKATRYNFILIYYPYIPKFHIGKIYNTRNITTVDIGLTVNEIVEINLDVVEIQDNVKRGFIREIQEKTFIKFNDSQGRKLKNLILQLNMDKITLDYFTFRNLNNPYAPEIFPQMVDSLNSALRIFRTGTREFHNLTEDQIMTWDLKTMFKDKIHETPDGLHFFRQGERNLYVHKVHSTIIESCLGVDMIYNYYDEKRLIFIQYKCLNYENSLFYKSMDKKHKKQIERMKKISGISDCYNYLIRYNENLRICKCPVYIKLCSRNIDINKTKPYGVYFPICIWEFFYQDTEKVSITLRDEPRISNSQFVELANKRLIGTIPLQSQEVADLLHKNAKDDTLTLIFNETNRNLNSDDPLILSHDENDENIEDLKDFD